MNIKKAIRLMIAISLGCTPLIANAQWALPQGSGLPTGSIYMIASGIMLWILIIFGFVGVIGFAISGILYLTAAGDETQIEKAKKAMTYSIVGAIIGISGYVFLQAAQQMLSGIGIF